MVPLIGIDCSRRGIIKSSIVQLHIDGRSAGGTATKQKLQISTRRTTPACNGFSVRPKRRCIEPERNGEIRRCQVHATVNVLGGRGVIGIDHLETRDSRDFAVRRGCARDGRGTSRQIHRAAVQGHVGKGIGERDQGLSG